MKKIYMALLILLLAATLIKADDISDCSQLSSAGTTYYLTNDILTSVTSPCMQFTNNSITLDCQGHIISGNNTGYGIFNNEAGVNETIKNCIISNWDDGIIIDGVGDDQTDYYFNLDNLTINDNGYGVRFGTWTITSVKGGHNITATNLHFSNNSQWAITVLGDSSYYDYYYWKNSRFSNITIDGGANGITTGGAESGIYDNLTITNLSGDAIVSGEFFNNSHITDNGGIGFQGGTVADSWIINNAGGGMKQGNAYNNLFNNTLNVVPYNLGWPYDGIDGLFNTYIMKSAYFGQYPFAVKENGTPIYGNRTNGQISGNFWAQPDGLGFSETCNDADNDGFCDMGYNLYANTSSSFCSYRGHWHFLPTDNSHGIDRYPLSEDPGASQTLGVTSCQFLDQPFTTYQLQNDILLDSNSTCFQICDQNITFDGQGRTLQFNGTGSSGIYFSHFSPGDTGIYGQNTIKNLNLANYSNGIYSASTNLSNINVTDINLSSSRISFAGNSIMANLSITNINGINSAVSVGYWFYPALYNVYINNITIQNGGRCFNNPTPTCGLYINAVNQNLTVSNINIGNASYGIYADSGSPSGSLFENISIINSSSSGLYSTGTFDSSIFNNISISDTGTAIAAGGYTNNSVFKNIEIDNSTTGMYFGYEGVENSNFTNITMNNCSGTGIYLDTSWTDYWHNDLNNFLNVTANNGGDGFYLYFAYNNTFTNMTSNNNTANGFHLVNSQHNNFSECTTNNNAGGFGLDSSSGNIISNSTIANSTSSAGIGFTSNSYNNTFYNSVIQNNSFYGLAFYYTACGAPNIFYNNLFNNSINYWQDTSSGTVCNDTFNTTQQNGTRIYGLGPRIGGNFWVNYSNICPDLDHNGFCDSSLVFNVTITHDYSTCFTPGNACSTYANQTDCEANASCYWDGSACYLSCTSCDTFTNDTDCNAQPGCYWGSAPPPMSPATRKRTQISVLNLEGTSGPSILYLDDGGESCQGSCSTCEDIGNDPDTCSGYPSCAWNSNITYTYPITGVDFLPLSLGYQSQTAPNFTVIWLSPSNNSFTSSAAVMHTYKPIWYNSAPVTCALYTTDSGTFAQAVSSHSLHNNTVNVLTYYYQTVGRPVLAYIECCNSTYCADTEIYNFTVLAGSGPGSGGRTGTNPTTPPGTNPGNGGAGGTSSNNFSYQQFLHEDITILGVTISRIWLVLLIPALIGIIYYESKRQKNFDVPMALIFIFLIITITVYIGLFDISFNTYNLI